MEKQRWEESGKRREEERRSEKRERKRERERESKERRCRMQVREKVEQSRATVFFPMVWKSRLAKAAGAEPSDWMRDEKLARRCGTKHISKSTC